jgi:predicted NUDIX family NTP pyrophosphohydrolase
MKKTSAGILLYRWVSSAGIELFLVHPGGPFWAKKDERAWSIPKGEYIVGEDPLEAARREFQEEVGTAVDGEFIPLAPIRQNGGKVVSAWAVEGTCDASAIRSNTFSMEWPPGSGRHAEFPEVDRAAWFSAEVAKSRLVKGQEAFVDELCAKLNIEVR